MRWKAHADASGSQLSWAATGGLSPELKQCLCPLSKSVLSRGQKQHLVLSEDGLVDCLHDVRIHLLILAVDAHGAPLEHTAIDATNGEQCAIILRKADTRDMACMPAVRSERSVVRHHGPVEELDE